MKYQQIADHIILQLKQMDVDGETMQYIIEEVGLKDQMLRQLIMQANSELLLDLIVENQEIDKC